MDDLTDALKNALTFVGDALLTVQQAKDGKAYGAAGYGARAAQDAVKLAENVVKIAKNHNHPPSPHRLNLTGWWQEDNGKRSNIVDYQNGKIVLRVGSDSGGHILYNGGALYSGDRASILVSGTNSHNDYLIVKCDADDSTILGTFWAPLRPEWAPQIIRYSRLDRLRRE